MVKTIKCEFVYSKKTPLRDDLYVKEDMSKFLSSTIYNTKRKDGVLEISKICLINKFEDTYKPFIKVILTICDETDNKFVETKIYRYLDEDIVQKITFGKSNLYRHEIKLVAPEKKLERVPVNSMAFTNFTDKHYNDENLSERVVEPSFNLLSAAGWLQGSFQADFYNEYGNDIRMLGPNVILNKEININIRPVVRGSAALQIIFIHWTRYYFNMPLTEFYVETPDKVKVNLLNENKFTFDRVGKFVFTQIFEVTNRDTNITTVETSGKVSLTWTINCVLSQEDIIRRYNIRQVVEKILENCELLREDYDNQKFYLDESQRTVLENIESPEFVFSGGTLYEALDLVGSMINAIPKIKPRLRDEDEGIDDYSDWGVVYFEFLGGDNKETGGKTSLYDATLCSDDFAKGFIANVQNATQSNYSDGKTIVEPFLDGFIAPRSEVETYEISNDSAVIKLTKNIQYISKVYCSSNGQTIDISGRVVEKAQYNRLPLYRIANESSDTRDCYLYYERGTNEIRGLTLLLKKDMFDDIAMEQQAIKNVLMIKETRDIESYIKNLSFRIEYIPIQDFKVRQYKGQIIEDYDDNFLYYNQKSNMLDTEAFGENIKNALLKTGNMQVGETQYFTNYSEVPNSGERSDDGYYSYLIEEEITIGSPVKATLNWSQYFNRLDDYTGLSKAIREYEISETECYERSPDYPEFCLVSTDLDVENYYFPNAKEGSEEYQITNAIRNELSYLGFGTKQCLSSIVLKLQNEKTDCKVSYVFVNTIAENIYNEKINSQFILPCSCFAFGNSLTLHFKTLDNFAAQMCSSYYNDKYNIEDYVTYGDEFGRFNTMGICFGCHSPIKNGFVDANKIRSNSQMLYKLNGKIDESDIVFDFRDKPFKVNKDSREQISFTGQLHFISTDKKIILGKGLAHTMPMIGDNSTYKFAYFITKPNRLESSLTGVSYIEDEMPSITVNHDIKTITIGSKNALQSCVGYGMIDSLNRLVFFVEDEKSKGEQTSPIFLMFRRRV